MQRFRYIEDIDRWLAPMDYSGFWYAIAPYELELQPKDHCDQQIVDGEIDEATVLDVLKYLARLELTKKLSLPRKSVTPWLKLVEAH